MAGGGRGVGGKSGKDTEETEQKGETARERKRGEKMGRGRMCDEKNGRTKTTVKRIDTGRGRNEKTWHGRGCARGRKRTDGAK